MINYIEQYPLVLAEFKEYALEHGINIDKLPDNYKEVLTKVGLAYIFDSGKITIADVEFREALQIRENKLKSEQFDPYAREYLSPKVDGYRAFRLVSKKTTADYDEGETYPVVRYGKGMFDVYCGPRFKGEWDKIRFQDEEDLYKYFYSEVEREPDMKVKLIRY